MAIPTYEQLMLPVLQEAGSRSEPVGIIDLIKPIATSLGLSEADLGEKLPSGRQGVFHNRLHWAKFYMSKAGLLEATQRGKFRITDRGREVLASRPVSLSSTALRDFPDFVEFIGAGASGEDRQPSVHSPKLVIIPVELDLTPAEALEVARREMEAALRAELLDRIRALLPSEFEELIVSLLLKMGYGEGAEELAKALGGSSDGGIDGVVHQDPLGLDRVYIQAKRWKDGNVVGSKDIRDFNGALDIVRAPKGLFVTASSFTREAQTSARDASRQIVLIDGEQLAHLMVRHQVGVRVRTPVIKRATHRPVSPG